MNQREQLYWLEELLVRAVERRLNGIEQTPTPMSYTEAWHAGWDAASVDMLARALCGMTGERREVVIDRATRTARAFQRGHAPLLCPRCGSESLQAVNDGELVNFLCIGCRACWHVSLGYIERVDPTTCPGCEARDLCPAGVAGE